MACEKAEDGVSGGRRTQGDRGEGDREEERMKRGPGETGRPGLTRLDE